MNPELRKKKFIFGNHSDRGMVKLKNEDYMAYFDTPNGDLFIVCDGMGGHEGGAKASEIAVESLQQFFRHEINPDPVKLLHDGIQYANTKIHQFAHNYPDFHGMGTTCVVLLIKGNECYYAHAGDSRMYIQINGRLTQLTKDHSFIQDLIDQEQLSEENARTDPRRNVITKALGIRPAIEPSVSKIPIIARDGDYLLLCTDGLTVPLEKEEIEEIIDSEDHIQNKVLRLVDAANEKGGPDNITVQLIKFQSTKAENPPIIPPVSPELTTEPEVNIEPVTAKKKVKDEKADKLLNIGIITMAAAILILGFTMFFDSPNAKNVQITYPEDPVSQNIETPENIETEEIAPPSGNNEKTAPARETKPKPAEKVTPAPDKKKETPAPAVSKTGTSQNYYKLVVTNEKGLYEISKRFNIAPDAIQKANSLDNKNVIKKGQELKIPVKAVYKVKQGDGLLKLERDFKTTKDLLKKANPGLQLEKLKPGDELIVPLS